MTIDQAIDKARKLLALATSDNPNEAASAAAKAQAILERYSISVAMLEIDGDGDAPDEPIDDSRSGSEPLDAGSALPTYRKVLANCVAQVNGCYVYSRRRAMDSGHRRSSIEIAGRASDVAKVRYLYAFLAKETDRLTDRDGKGMGRTWRNNFRIGCVQTITKALRAAKAQTLRDFRGQAGTDEWALVRVNKVMERLDAKNRELMDWVRKNLNISGSARSTFTADRGAYAAGVAAGREVQIGGARRALGAGRQQLKR